MQIRNRPYLILLMAVLAMVMTACVEAGAPPSVRPTPKVRPSGPIATAPDVDPSGTALISSKYGPAEFWLRMGGGLGTMEVFDSLGSITSAADLVIVGNLQGFSKGPVLKLDNAGAVAYTYRLRLRVEQTIKG